MKKLLATAALAATLLGCNKPVPKSAVDVVRLSVDQVVCVLARAELGATDPTLVAGLCAPGSGVDTVLQEVEKLLVAAPRAKSLAAAERGAQGKK